MVIPRRLATSLSSFLRATFVSAFLAAARFGATAFSRTVGRGVGSSVLTTSGIASLASTGVGAMVSGTGCASVVVTLGVTGSSGVVRPAVLLVGRAGLTPVSPNPRPSGVPALAVSGLPTRGCPAGVKPALSVPVSSLAGTGLC